MKIPLPKQNMLNLIQESLKAVPQVQAVVLGGSYARGVARDDSDLDIGIYYSESSPFAIDDIREIAISLSGQADQQVTNFYGWGAWVNGGGWIQTPICKVDFLYRNIDQVQRTIQEALQGITHHDFDQQPAYGFYSIMYLGETKTCQPLYDPNGIIAHLKTQVSQYPPMLKEKFVSSSLWMAEFSLIHAANFASTGNVYTTAGTLTRTASFMTQALFAMNETYYISDKTALQEIVDFSLRPSGYTERLSAVLGQPGLSAEELLSSVDKLHGLWADLVKLTDGAYHPAFKL